MQQRFRLEFKRQKRPVIAGKETCTCNSRTSDLLEETCYYRGKRDLLQRQKRPTTEAKETYYRDKRDLLQRQKIPTVKPSLKQDCSHITDSAGAVGLHVRGDFVFYY